jgi:hypothetical protein
MGNCAGIVVMNQNNQYLLIPSADLPLQSSQKNCTFRISIKTSCLMACTTSDCIKCKFSAEAICVKLHFKISIIFNCSISCSLKNVNTLQGTSSQNIHAEKHQTQVHIIQNIITLTVRVRSTVCPKLIDILVTSCS